LRTVRVKISSEAAGTIALTPVIVQEMTFDDLIERIAAVTGKDRPRIDEVLKRGTVVSSGSRLRWDLIDATEVETSLALAKLPNPDPTIRFDPQQCREIVLRAERTAVSLTRQVGSKKRLFSRSSFWAHIIATFPAPAYCTYSYAERADVYHLAISDEQRAALHKAASLLAYSALATKVRALFIEHVDFYCPR
jgi:hypothetical protein